MWVPLGGQMNHLSTACDSGAARTTLKSSSTPTPDEQTVEGFQVGGE